MSFLVLSFFLNVNINSLQYGYVCLVLTPLYILKTLHIPQFYHIYHIPISLFRFQISWKLGLLICILKKQLWWFWRLDQGPVCKPPGERRGTSGQSTLMGFSSQRYCKAGQFEIMSNSRQWKWCIVTCDTHTNVIHTHTGSSDTHSHRILNTHSAYTRQTILLNDVEGWACFISNCVNILNLFLLALSKCVVVSWPWIQQHRQTICAHGYN